MSFGLVGNDPCPWAIIILVGKNFVLRQISAWVMTWVAIEVCCSNLLLVESAHGITVDWRHPAVYTFGSNSGLRESMLPLGCSQSKTEGRRTRTWHFSPVQDWASFVQGFPEALPWLRLPRNSTQSVTVASFPLLSWVSDLHHCLKTLLLPVFHRHFPQ